MNKLDEILKRKNEEIEIRESKVADSEANRNEIEKTKQKVLEEEFQIKEAQKIRSKLLESEETIRKRKRATGNAVVENAKTYGLIGLIIGAIIGFGKGCIKYQYVPPSIDSGDSFFVPFRDIPTNAIILCLVGLVIGILVGINKGQNT